MFILVGMPLGLVTGGLSGPLWRTFWFLQVGWPSQNSMYNNLQSTSTKKEHLPPNRPTLVHSSLNKESTYVGRFGDKCSFLVDVDCRLLLAVLILCHCTDTIHAFTVQIPVFFSFGRQFLDLSSVGGRTLVMYAHPSPLIEWICVFGPFCPFSRILLVAIDYLRALTNSRSRATGIMAQDFGLSSASVKCWSCL